MNGSNVVSRSNCDSHIQHYWRTTNQIRVKTNKTDMYSLYAQRVYARKSSGGKWDVVLNETNGDHELFINDSEGYVEYGFEFYVVAGRDWPYSNVFWTAADSAREKLDDVYIMMTGTTYNVDLNIYVNGKNI